MSVYKPEELNNIINRIKIKIENNHDFKANTTISKEDICKFEVKNGIRLPIAYRRFISEVANGGILSNNFNVPSLYEIIIDKQKVSSPFPLENFWFWGDNDIEKTDVELYNSLENGNITILDSGCGMSWNLIVCGNCEGEMWNFSEVGVQSSYPRRDFLSWFEYLLEYGDDFYADFDYKESNKIYDQVNKT